MLRSTLGSTADSNPAHGLATSAWLAEDVGVPLLPERGRIILSTEPGLGFLPQAWPAAPETAARPVI